MPSLFDNGMREFSGVGTVSPAWESAPELYDPPRQEFYLPENVVSIGTWTNIQGKTEDAWKWVSSFGGRVIGTYTVPQYSPRRYTEFPLKNGVLGLEYNPESNTGYGSSSGELQDSYPLLGIEPFVGSDGVAPFASFYWAVVANQPAHAFQGSSTYVVDYASPAIISGSSVSFVLAARRVAGVNYWVAYAANMAGNLRAPGAVPNQWGLVVHGRSDGSAYLGTSRDAEVWVKTSAPGASNNVGEYLYLGYSNYAGYSPSRIGAMVLMPSRPTYAERRDIERMLVARYIGDVPRITGAAGVALDANASRSELAADLALRNLTAFFLADASYTTSPSGTSGAGATWVGKASAGASSYTIAESVNPWPSTGATLNGYTAARFTRSLVDEIRTGRALSTFFPNGASFAGTIAVVLRANYDPYSDPSDGYTYFTQGWSRCPAIMATGTSGRFGCYIRSWGDGTARVGVGIFTSTGDKWVETLIQLGVLQIVQFKSDGSYLYIRVGREAPWRKILMSAGTLAIDDLTYLLQIGRNPGENQGLDFDLFGFALEPQAFASDADADAVSRAFENILTPFPSSGATALETFLGGSTGTMSALASSVAALETFAGAAAPTMAARSASSSGAEAFTGSATCAEQPFVLAATGTELFTGSAAGSLLARSASGTAAEAFVASAACALQAFALASAGAELFTGSGTSSSSPFAATAAGTTISAYTGAATGTTSSLSASAIAFETFAGTAAASQASGSASGSGGQAFAGSATCTTSSLGASSSGVEAFAGSSASTTSSLSSSASAAEAFVGSGTAALLARSAAGTAAEAFAGSGACTMTSRSVAATGGETFAGAGTCATSTLSSSAAGLETYAGAAAVALQALALSAAGTPIFAGTAAVALASLTANAAGSELFSAAVTAALQQLALAATGAELFTGTATAIPTEPEVYASSSSQITIYGDAAASSSPLVLAGVARETFAAVGSAALSVLAAVGAATERFTGTATAARALLASSSTGVERFTGTAANAMTTRQVFAVVVEAIAGAAAGSTSPLALSSSAAELFTGAAAASFAARSSVAIAVEEFDVSGALVLLWPSNVAAASAFIVNPVSGGATSGLGVFSLEAEGVEAIYGDAAARVTDAQASALAELLFIGAAEVDAEGFDLDALLVNTPPPITGAAHLDADRFEPFAAVYSGFFGSAGIELRGFSLLAGGYSLHDIPPPGDYVARVLAAGNTRVRPLLAPRTVVRMLTAPRVRVRFRK